VTLELHRLRIDTVDEGVGFLDDLIDTVEKLYTDSALAKLDDVYATAVFESEADDADHEKALARIRDSLEEILSSRTDPAAEGVTFDSTLTAMSLRLKMLRDWLNDAQLDYDARKTAQP
jgi:hypothetical protein